MRQMFALIEDIHMWLFCMGEETAGSKNCAVSQMLQRHNTVGHMVILFHDLSKTCWQWNHEVVSVNLYGSQSMWVSVRVLIRVANKQVWLIYLGFFLCSLQGWITALLLWRWIKTITYVMKTCICTSKDFGIGKLILPLTLYSHLPSLHLTMYIAIYLASSHISIEYRNIMKQIPIEKILILLN